MRTLCFIAEGNISALLTKQYLCEDNHTLYMHARCETVINQKNNDAEISTEWRVNGEPIPAESHVSHNSSLRLFMKPFWGLQLLPLNLLSFAL